VNLHGDCVTSCAEQDVGCAGEECLQACGAMMSNTWTLIEANETRIFCQKVLELHRRSYDATNQHGMVAVYGILQ
jgi:hypothetical protein